VNLAGSWLRDGDPRRPRPAACALAALLAAAAGIPASQVTFLPLARVLDPGVTLVEGTVHAVSFADSGLVAWALVELDSVTTWRGPAAGSGLWCHSLRRPVWVDSTGREIGHYSPILDASGLEFNLQPGGRYLFLGRGASAGPCRPFFRAEPDSARGRLLELLARPMPAAAPGR
jgi:hypothetical protein